MFAWPASRADLSLNPYAPLFPSVLSPSDADKLPIIRLIGMRNANLEIPECEARGRRDASSTREIFSRTRRIRFVNLEKSVEERERERDRQKERYLYEMCVALVLIA